MNKPISFSLAKLLKECRYNTPTLNFFFEDGESKENVLKETVGMDYGSEFTVEFSELIENWNDKWLTKKNGDRCFGCKKSNGYFETFSAPTIAEVVMWIYEKYSLWILPLPTITGCFVYKIVDVQLNPEKPIERPPYNDVGAFDYNSPTEAYESAIEYTLTKLI